jgi:hypothetical protein
MISGPVLAAIAATARQASFAATPQAARLLLRSPGDDGHDDAYRTANDSCTREAVRQGERGHPEDHVDRHPDHPRRCAHRVSLAHGPRLMPVKNEALLSPSSSPPVPRAEHHEQAAHRAEAVPRQRRGEELPKDGNTEPNGDAFSRRPGLGPHRHDRAHGGSVAHGGPG